MLIFAAIYTMIVIPSLLDSPEALATLASPTLQGVQALLSSDSGTAAGWVHFLCFDLFVGSSVWKSAINKKQSFLWVSPILLLILMLGPLGWLVYQGLQFLDNKSEIEGA